jgi:hypothetical protein
LGHPLGTPWSSLPIAFRETEIRPTSATLITCLLCLPGPQLARQWSQCLRHKIHIQPCQCRHCVLGTKGLWPAAPIPTPQWGELSRSFPKSHGDRAPGKSGGRVPMRHSPPRVQGVERGETTRLHSSRTLECPARQPYPQDTNGQHDRYSGVSDAGHNPLRAQRPYCQAAFFPYHYLSPSYGCGN